MGSVSALAGAPYGYRYITRERGGGVARLEIVPEEARNLVVGEDSVTAVVVGRTSEPRHLVKAVTYHGLELHRDRDGWRGNVVLDV